MAEEKFNIEKFVSQLENRLPRSKSVVKKRYEGSPKDCVTVENNKATDCIIDKYLDADKYLNADRYLDAD